MKYSWCTDFVNFPCIQYIYLEIYIIYKVVCSSHDWSIFLQIQISNDHEIWLMFQFLKIARNLKCWHNYHSFASKLLTRIIAVWKWCFSLPWYTVLRIEEVHTLCCFGRMHGWMDLVKRIAWCPTIKLPTWISGIKTA